MIEPIEITLAGGRRAEIRAAAASDVAGVLLLERALLEDGRGMVQALDQTPSADDVARAIDTVYRQASNGSASLLLLATLDGQVLGSGKLAQLVPARCSHVGVLSLGVHPRAQRLGVGRAILRELIAHAERFGLERLELYVRTDNQRARALYESERFAREGVRERFVKLEDGRYVDDLVMVRFLA